MTLRKYLTSILAFLLGFASIVLAGKVVFPRVSHTTVVPNGIYLQGLVVGLLAALLAVGLVLVYRTNRIINFAQGELGAFAATMTSELYEIFRWSYFAAIAVGLVATVLTSMLVEWGVIRRFAKAPRLILTVATIGVAQILGAIELAIPYIINRGKSTESIRTSLTSPFSFSFNIGIVRFKGDHVLVLIVTPLILLGLFLFFRYSRYGVAARAAAENDERARLLGVPIKRVSLIVWAVAGFLSALTAILRAPILGFTFGSIAGQGLLLRALAAGVIGRMENLTVTAVAAVLLTMAEQTIFFSYLKSGPTDGFFFAVVVIALLLQHKRMARADPQSSSWRAVKEVRPVPGELAKLPEVRWLRLAVGGLLTVLLLVLPFTISQASASLAGVILIYAMVGVSLVMLTGWSGNVSLGQWAIVGVGGLVAGKLAAQTIPQNFFIAILVASLIGAAVSLAIGLPALRIRGLFLGVTTLGFAIAGANWFFQWDIMTPAGAIRRPTLLITERAFYFVCLAGLAFALFAARNVRRTRLGRGFIAIRDNELQGQAYGIRPTRTKLIAFALSGFLAALAGSLYAYHQGALRGARFPPEDSLAIFSMVVIGGMGSLSGALLGAVYVRGTQLFLPAAFQLFATGIGLLLLLLIFPGGLGQIFFGWRDRYLRRVAARRGLVVPSLVADRRVEEDESLIPALVGRGGG